MEQITCISNVLSIGIVSLFVTICFLVFRNFLAIKAKHSSCDCDETIYTGEVTPDNNILVASGGGKISVFELLRQADNEEPYVTQSGTIYRNKTCQKCCEEGDSDSCLSKDRIVILHEAPTNFSVSSASRSDDKKGRDGRDSSKPGMSSAYTQPPAEGSRQTGPKSSPRTGSSPGSEADPTRSGVGSSKTPPSKDREGASIGSSEKSQYPGSKTGVRSSKSGPASDSDVTNLSASAPTVDIKGLKTAVSTRSEEAPSLSSDTKRSTASNLSPARPSTPSTALQSGDTAATHKGDSSSLVPATKAPVKAGDDNSECESVCICGVEASNLTLKGKIKFGCQVCKKKYKCICTTQADGKTTVHEVTIGVKKGDSSTKCPCANKALLAGRFIINIKLPKGSTKQ